MPAGIGDRTGFEEDAEVGARERCLLVGIDAAALHLFTARHGAGGVVAAVKTYSHALSLPRPHCSIRAGPPRVHRRAFT